MGIIQTPPKLLYWYIMYQLFVLFLVAISFPLQGIIGMLIVVSSGLPVLFLQKRIGENGKPFVMYKFRTMKAGAEKKQGSLRRHNEADGPVFKLRNDPRYTAIGKTLAHTGLDEIPQLYNVLRGDMALFGPRPLPPAEAAKLKPWQKKRHDIKPGIISPAILTGTYHQDFDAWMKSDIAYIKEKRFLYDVQLAFRTIKFLARLLVDEIVG